MFCNHCGVPNPDVASFCNKCGKAMVRKPAGDPTQAKPIDPIAAMPSAPAPIQPALAVLASPISQETFAKLSPPARTEFTDGLTIELRRQIDDKSIPVSLAAGIVTLIAFARFLIPEFGDKYGALFAFAAAFVLTGVVYKITRAILEDKYLRPIANISDEMLVTRYNEAKADRRAARTWTTLSWGVIAIIFVVFLIVWLAVRR
jgi:hypothetical protein